MKSEILATIEKQKKTTMNNNDELNANDQTNEKTRQDKTKQRWHLK